MAERWQQWMPFHIDRWKGSAHVQAMRAAARAGYLYLLSAAWQTDFCCLPDDDEELMVLASLTSEEWSQYGPMIRKRFVKTDNGLRNEVEFEEWNEAKRVFESRQTNARRTNTKRTTSDERTESVRRASRNADTHTGTVTSTGTKTNAVSKTTSSHPGASLGAVQTLHPDMSIYEKYPRKEGKGAALEAIRKAVARLVKGEAPHPPMVKIDAQRFLMRRVLEYERSPVGRQADKTKLPHPATWFNQKRYDDDQANWHQLERIHGNESKGDAAYDALKRSIQAGRNQDPAGEVGDSEAGEGGGVGVHGLLGGPDALRDEGYSTGTRVTVIPPTR